jgi:hypothetical protein
VPRLKISDNILQEQLRMAMILRQENMLHTLIQCQDIQWLVTGKNKNEKSIMNESNSIYEELETNLFPESIHLSFKDECGEYPTASSYAVWKAVKTSINCTTPTNILIYNHHHSINHSLILIRKSV